ncbi:MAG TPA: VWA domain-containing protein, partial [Acidimicrobiales bacterium]
MSSDLLGSTDLAEVAGRFAALLHEAGLPVTPQRAGRLTEVLRITVPAHLDELYWAVRVVLVTDVTQLPVFDRVFAQVFRGHADPADGRGDPNAPPVAAMQAGERRPPADRAAGGHGTSSGAARSGGARSEEQPEDERAVATAPASADELLRHKDFGRCTPEELALLHQLLADLEVAVPLRPSRRTGSHPHGRDVDLRATLRAAHRTGGDPVRLARRRRRDRPRRVVLVADVSGSMEPYARAYLTLLHGAARVLGAETFVFATRLTRLTRRLGVSDPQLALAQAMADAPDWAGGTRIGVALGAFNDGWGRRGLARRAVVVIVSDGWEGGDAAL